MTDLFDDSSRAVLERRIDEWCARVRGEWSSVLAAGRSTDEPDRWFVRLRGEEKETITVWFLLGQRTLRHETYVLPTPTTHSEELLRYCLRRNERLVGHHFGIGAEDALHIYGELLLESLDDAELDRIVGSVYATIERHFAALVELAFPGLSRSSR
jgi:hypothetical protein